MSFNKFCQEHQALGTVQRWGGSWANNEPEQRAHNEIFTER